MKGLKQKKEKTLKHSANFPRYFRYFQDYGTLYCLGENAVGHQLEPCAFQIVPTGTLIIT